MANLGPNLSQRLSQSQTLALTPAMQLKLKLWQMNLLELSQTIERELGENPLLELLEDGDEVPTLEALEEGHDSEVEPQAQEGVELPEGVDSVDLGPLLGRRRRPGPGGFPRGGHLPGPGDRDRRRELLGHRTAAHQQPARGRAHQLGGPAEQHRDPPGAPPGPALPDPGRGRPPGAHAHGSAHRPRGRQGLPAGGPRPGRRVHPGGTGRGTGHRPGPAAGAAGHPPGVRPLGGGLLHRAGEPPAPAAPRRRRAGRPGRADHPGPLRPAHPARQRQAAQGHRLHRGGPGRGPGAAAPPAPGPGPGLRSGKRAGGEARRGGAAAATTTPGRSTSTTRPCRGCG